MKLTKKLLFVTALISAFLTLSVLAAQDAPLIISPAPVENAQETAAEIKYPDIPEDASYADSVYKLSKAGVLQGYEDGSFRPEGEVTRAEMAKMVILTFGLADDYEKSAGFPDVHEEDWFYPYVLAIQNKHIVQGYENGEYRPQNNITRAEVCTIIYRMFEDDGENKKVLETSPFIPFIPEREISDLAEDHWAKKYVKTIVNNYLMPLEQNNTFRPTENIKRYELAQLLAKFVVVEPIEEITAEIKFFVGDEQWGETDIVPVGATPDAPDENPIATEEGKAFKGWKRKGTAGTNVLDLSAETITEPGTVEYEAVFDKIWTVTFMNGDIVHEEWTMFDGEKIADKPKDPRWPSGSSILEFKGWSFDSNAYSEETDIITVIGYMVKKNLTFYARYYDPDAAADTEDEYEPEPTNPNSQQLMDTLMKGKVQLEDVSDAASTTKIKFLCVVLGETLDGIIASAENGKTISKRYVQTQYKNLIAELKSYILYGYENEDGEPAGTILLNHPSRPASTSGLSGSQANEFRTLLSNKVSQDVQDFIIDYFDLQGELDELEQQ